MNTCVIVPAYNEARNLPNLIRQIKDKRLAILVIDDGSIDDTFNVAKQYGVMVLKNDKNQGKGASLIKGFSYALANNFSSVIIIDGDGQHDPQEIDKFIEKAQSSSSQFFIGNRMLDLKTMPALRLATNRFMSWLISVIIKQNIPDTQCGFKLIQREVLEKIRLKSSKYEIESELLIKASRAGFKIESIPIKTIYQGEKSKIKPFVDTLRFIKFIIKETFLNTDSHG